MTIELTREMESIVSDQLSSGRYSSAQAVLQDALNSMKSRNEHDVASPGATAQNSCLTQEELDGRARSLEDLFARIDAEGPFEDLEIDRHTFPPDQREPWLTLSRLYLLDTNTVAYLVSGRSRGVRERYRALQGSGRFAVSAVTEGELQFGLARRPDAVGLRRNVLEFLAKVSIMPWTTEVAAPYGKLRAMLQASGTTLSPLDLMIAGHAYAVSATLVTHDAALKRLTAFLAIEDWVDSESERQQT